MLVFQRHLGEQVVITFNGPNGPEICRVSLQAAHSRGKASLGFEAGPNVRIDREEIYLARLEGEKPNQPISRKE